MPQFQIIYGPKEQAKEEWKVHVELSNPAQYEGNKRVTWDKWGSPQEANPIVKRLNAAFKSSRGYVAMLRRIPDPVDYIARETNRADYQPFEIQGKEFHCSQFVPPETVTFYADIYAAYDDRRTEMKLGRYLHKYTSKNDNEIGEICARYGVAFGDCDLYFAKTREEIKKVYETGPRSCMSGEANEYGIGDGIHPTEAYASGDFEIAYCIRDERITGRAVVIPSKKVWAAIYGDYTRLSSLLEAAGYKRADGNEGYGMKLLKIEANGRIAAPFLDIEGRVAFHEDGKHLVISNTGGYTSEDGYVYSDLSSPEDCYDDDYDYDY